MFSPFRIRIRKAEAILDAKPEARGCCATVKGKCVYIVPDTNELEVINRIEWNMVAQGCTYKIPFGQPSMMPLPAARRPVNDLHSRKEWCEEGDMVQRHDYDSCGGLITQL